jgi:peptide methionine sulfoxide reductase msrA/msrB
MSNPTIYCCQNCQNPLFLSKHILNQADSSIDFDAEIVGNIKKNNRDHTVACAKCNQTLGQLFYNEKLSKNNVRQQIPVVKLSTKTEADFGVAVVACGCFWGTEHWYRKLDGVLDIVAGYTGGGLLNPDYNSVKTGTTGHLESVKIVFDSSIISYQEILKYYYEIHDFEQTDGQGYDLGNQYKSAIFVANETEKTTAQNLIDILNNKGYKVATQILPQSKWYDSEEYHQDYITKNGGIPDCHFRTRIW